MITEQWTLLDAKAASDTALAQAAHAVAAEGVGIAGGVDGVGGGSCGDSIGDESMPLKRRLEQVEAALASVVNGGEGTAAPEVGVVRVVRPTKEAMPIHPLYNNDTTADSTVYSSVDADSIVEAYGGGARPGAVPEPRADRNLRQVRG
jgi:hypothetical protein